MGLYSPKTKMIFIYLCFVVVVQLLSSVVSDSLQPHELQYTRLLCPSLSPWIFSDLCPLSQWCHPTIFPLLPLSPLASSFPSIKNPMFMFIGLKGKNYNFFNLWKTWNQNFSVHSKILLEYILLFCTLYLRDSAGRVTFFNMALAFL